MKKPTSCGLLAWSYLREHKARFLWALLWRGLYVIAPMQVPVITGAIVDGLTGKDVHVYGNHWRGPEPTDVLWSAVLALMAVAAVYGISSYLRLMAAAQLSRHFVFDLRHKIIRHTARLSIEQHQKFGAAELMDRTLTDTRQMRRFLDRVYIQSTANFLRIGYPVAMLLLLDWSLALVALSVLLPQWLISRQLHRCLHSAAERRRTSQSDLTGVVKESLDGVETIKSLDADRSSMAIIGPRANQLEADELTQNRWTALINANVWCMTSVGVALVWGLGGARVLAGGLTLGQLVVFTGFMAFVYQPFRQFTTIVTTYREGLVSLQRITELLQERPAICERPDSRPLVISEGRIELRGVDFSYGQRPALRGVNQVIAPRQLTAVVGRSGSGKSSLLRLIMRFYDPDRGGVLIDGQPLQRATLSSVRAQVAMVNQQSMIFSGTVLDNIRLARPEASPVEVRRACRAAGALEFIESLADGFETRLGTGGALLSGGQAQRIAIARALLNEPRILVLDEPTSALDAESEAAIVATMQRLSKEITVVVAAHRPRTVRSADHLLVMDRGRVVASGTHDELGGHCDVYQELFASHERVYAGAA